MSTPNISSSGNVIPQSIIMISFLYSKTVIFLPISPIPPSGMIFNLSVLLTLSLLISFIFLSIALLFIMLDIEKNPAGFIDNHYNIHKILHYDLL